jgi:hypothetical protein
VQQRPVTERLRLAGVVAVRSGNKATVPSHIAGHLVPPPGAALPALGSRVLAGQVLAMVQPHVAGTELVTFLNTQRQIQTMDVELTVKAAEAEAETIRARAALTQADGRGVLMSGPHEHAQGTIPAGDNHAHSRLSRRLQQQAMQPLRARR